MVKWEDETKKHTSEDTMMEMNPTDYSPKDITE
jgi:hypothetical protein